MCHKSRETESRLEQIREEMFDFMLAFNSQKVGGGFQVCAKLHGNLL